MQWTNVSSTVVARIGYDATTQTLGLEYSSGHIYHYFDVPQHVFEELMQASSHGQYIVRNIKGFYRYARV